MHFIPQNKVVKYTISTLLVIGFFFLAFLANQYAKEHDVVKDIALKFGYSGIFVMAIISGLNVIIPIPIIAFYPFFVQSGLESWGVIACITLGMTVGDVVAYGIGRSGRMLFTDRMLTMVERLDRLKERHWLLPLVFLFVYAVAVPLPNELVIIPLALLRWRLSGILIAVLLGNAIFNTLVAHGFFQIFDVLPAYVGP